MLIRNLFLDLLAIFFASTFPLISAYAAECSDIELCKNVPPGFTLYQSKNHTGSFLQPEGWFLKEEVIGETSALLISKENIDVTGRFLTGLSVNKVPNLLKKTKILASKYARDVAFRLRASGVILRAGIVSGNSIDMNVVRKKITKYGESVIVHYITIGNDDTDTFYMISFEAPENEWKDEEKFGTPMLNFFAL